MNKSAQEVVRSNEEVIKVSFILDNVPSFLLTISKTEHNEDGPQVIFRILSLMAKSDTDEPNNPQAHENLSDQASSEATFNTTPE